MISAMNVRNETQANTLCKSCGLCCTGHLFIWTKLRSTELDSIEALGVEVFRSVPHQRGFNQPCPLWQGQCTIYASPGYPRFCQTYKCKLLKQLLDGTASLHEALQHVERTKGTIQELEALLPDSTKSNFRERLVTQLETAETMEIDFRRKATELLTLYDKVFGVSDLVEPPTSP